MSAAKWFEISLISGRQLFNWLCHTDQYDKWLHGSGVYGRTLTFCVSSSFGQYNLWGRLPLYSSLKLLPCERRNCGQAAGRVDGL